MKKRVKLLTAAIVFTLVYILVNIISFCSFSTKDRKYKSDVAIILGASVINGEVSPVYQERINHGIYLYHERYVDKLIVTGGIGMAMTDPMRMLQNSMPFHREYQKQIY